MFRTKKVIQLQSNNSWNEVSNSIIKNSTVNYFYEISLKSDVIKLIPHRVTPFDVYFIAHIMCNKGKNLDNKLTLAVETEFNKTLLSIFIVLLALSTVFGVVQFFVSVNISSILKVVYVIGPWLFFFFYVIQYYVTLFNFKNKIYPILNNLESSANARI